MALTLTPLSGLPLVQPGDDLALLALQAASRMDLAWQSGDILVLAQKIISKAEGRQVYLPDVTPTAAAYRAGCSQR